LASSVIIIGYCQGKAPANWHLRGSLGTVLGTKALHRGAKRPRLSEARAERHHDFQSWGRFLTQPISARRKPLANADQGYLRTGF